MYGKVRAFLDAHDLRTDVQSRYIDLVSEVGEVGKDILLATEYGKKIGVPMDGLQGELGDCLFSLLALYDAAGVDPEKALDAALCKYNGRLSNKGTVGSDTTKG